jgi:hypothetical protein
MLFGNNVLQMKAGFDCCVWQSTILAPVTGALANESLKLGLIHDARSYPRSVSAHLARDFRIASTFVTLR